MRKGGQFGAGAGAGGGEYARWLRKQGAARAEALRLASLEAATVSRGGMATAVATATPVVPEETIAATRAAVAEHTALRATRAAARGVGMARAYWDGYGVSDDILAALMVQVSGLAELESKGGIAAMEEMKIGSAKRWTPDSAKALPGVQQVLQGQILMQYREADICGYPRPHHDEGVAIEEADCDTDTDTVTEAWGGGGVATASPTSDVHHQGQLHMRVESTGRGAGAWWPKRTTRVLERLFGTGLATCSTHGVSLVPLSSFAAMQRGQGLSQGEQGNILAQYWLGRTPHYEGSSGAGLPWASFAVRSVDQFRVVVGGTAEAVDPDGDTQGDTAGSEPRVIEVVLNCEFRGLPQAVDSPEGGALLSPGATGGAVWDSWCSVLRDHFVVCGVTPFRVISPPEAPDHQIALGSFDSMWHPRDSWFTSASTIECWMPYTVNFTSGSGKYDIFPTTVNKVRLDGVPTPPHTPSLDALWSPDIRVSSPREVERGTTRVRVIDEMTEHTSEDEPPPPLSPPERGGVMEVYEQPPEFYIVNPSFTGHTLGESSESEGLEGPDGDETPF